jgi:hypothetical protein
LSEPAGRRVDRGARPPSIYRRYRYLERVFCGRLREQERKVHRAQLALDAALAEDERELIRSERRLWEDVHLNEEPSRRSVE